MMMKRLSSDAVERILRAVGLEIKSTQISSHEDDEPPAPYWNGQPPVRDVSLVASLYDCISYYHGAVQAQSDKKKLDRIRRLRSISKVAGRLEDLLKPDGGWERTEGSERTFLLAYIPVFQRRVEWEIGDLERKLEWGDDADNIGLVESRDLTDSLRKRSPFEWLVGAYLPETFRKCFGKKPTLRRKDNKLYGPYIQFAEQVLIEFEITKNGRPYGREAIAKALGDVKHGRTRRVPRRR
jgi:hypothetical protein